MVICSYFLNFFLRNSNHKSFQYTNKLGIYCLSAYYNNLWLFRYKFYAYEAMDIVYCCVVDLCLRRSASVAYIDFTRLPRHRWSRRHLASTSSHQVAARRHSLTMPSAWSWWSHWCQKFASITSGPKLETFLGICSPTYAIAFRAKREFCRNYWTLLNKITVCWWYQRKTNMEYISFPFMCKFTISFVQNISDIILFRLWISFLQVHDTQR